MDVSDHFSVYPGKSNNPDDTTKGRTFRRLNVSRKLPSRMSPDYLPRRSTCKRSPWVIVASANAEAAPWEVLYPQPSALWSFPSVNRYGPSTSNKSFPIITYLSNIFDTLTIASFLETLVSGNFPHTKSFSMKASMANPSSLKLHQAKNFSVSCLKPNRWSSSTQVQPTSSPVTILSFTTESSSERF